MAVVACQYSWFDLLVVGCWGGLIFENAVFFFGQERQDQFHLHIHFGVQLIFWASDVFLDSLHLCLDLLLRLGDVALDSSLDFILNGVYFGLRLGDDAKLRLLDVLLDSLFDTFSMLCDVFLDLLNDALEVIVLLKLVVVCVGNDDVVESGWVKT